MTLTDPNIVVLLLHTSYLSKDTFLADWNHQQILKTFISDVQHNT